MNDSFKRILALARRTGDRLIVTDPDGKESFVLLSLDQYEDLLGGPKDEPPLPPPPPPAVEPGSAVPEPVLPPPPEAPAVPPARKIAVVTAPVPAVPAAAEALAVPAKAEDQEFGEEQFYLEPIE